MDGYISNKKHILCGWSTKIFQGKVMCNTRSKNGGKERWNLQEKLHFQDREDINLISTHPREIFLKIVGAIDIGKGEVMFDINGVRSAFKSTMIRGMQHHSC
jgi:hypothetical protein